MTKTNENSVDIKMSIRSSVRTRSYSILEKVQKICELLDIGFTIKSEAPAFEYKRESVLRDISIELYKEMYQQEPQVIEIHAGVELGVFSSKIKDMDAILFGPDIYDYHSPAEKTSISSVKRVYEFLIKLLEKLAK